MKNNKMFIYLFVFMFGLLFIGIDGVYADSKCTYKSSGSAADWKKNTEISVWLNNGKLKADCTDDIIRESIADLTINEGCMIQDKDISSLFVVDGNTLYCPKQIYANFDGRLVGTNLFDYSLSGTPRSDGETVHMQNPKTEGEAKVYTPQKNSSGSYIKCSTSGVNTTQIDILISDIEVGLDGVDSKTNIEYYSDLQEMISSVAQEIQKADDNSCNKGELLERHEKLSKLQTTLNKKIDSATNLSASDKNKLETNGEKNTALLSNLEEKLEQYYSTNGSEINVPYNDQPISCEHLLDEDLKKVINLVMDIVRIAVPVLLLVLTAVDFGQVVISQDQDAMKKAISKVIKRAIAAVALFFIPLLVKVMINWIDTSEYFNPENANCEEVYNK